MMHLGFNRRVFLALGLATSLVTGSSTYGRARTGDVACAPSPEGQLLVQERSASGRALADLLVVDPASGDELGRVTMPAVDAVFPTAIANRALAIAGRDLYLIDISTFTARIVPLDGETAKDLTPNPVQVRGTAGTRFLLLGSPSFDRAYLIDVEMGTATNLTDLIDPPAPDAPVFISFAAVTPDDAHVLLWDGQHVYVVASDNPSEARRLDEGAFAFAPDYSPDGSTVIYSASDGPGSGSTLVLEALDGSARDEIRTSEHAMVTLWVPSRNTVLVDERTETGAAGGSVYLLDLATGEETSLLTYSGSLTTVQFSPDGATALFGVEMVGSGTWYHADLVAGDVDEIGSLSGSRLLPGLYADSPWALAVPFGDAGGALTGPAYRGIDLATGAVNRIFAQPNDLDFLAQPVLSSDGRFSLVTGQTNARQTLWLLDAVELRAVELESAVTVAGLFSSDGCHVAVTIETAIDGLPGNAYSVHATSD
ncbi:MAG: hypothetical protein IT336_00150, partial [Thermomicrobiales bacterium]|nr:hypothetical protein [Thermomicrobiales bacterium]